MADAEVARHHVEGAIGERQMLNLGFAEIDTGMASLRQREHARGEVDVGRLRALLARGRGQRTGAAGDVEQLVALLETHGVQQRRNRVRGDRREEIVVALGERVVARTLERAESDSDSSGVIRLDPPAYTHAGWHRMIGRGENARCDLIASNRVGALARYGATIFSC